MAGRHAADGGDRATVFVVHQARRSRRGSADRARAAARVGALGGQALVARTSAWRHGSTALRYHSGVPSVSSGLDVLVSRPAEAPARPPLGLLAHQASVDARLEHAITLLRDVRAARMTALLRARARAVGRAPRITRPSPPTRDPAHRHPRDQSLRRAPRGRRRSMLAGLGRDGDRPPGRGLPLLHLRVDDGARHARAAPRPACRGDGAGPARTRSAARCLEGNIPDPAFASFVGLLSAAAFATGSPSASYARYLVARARLRLRPDGGADARRGGGAMLWEDTGVPWVAPSPNMPTLDTARVYPRRLP